LPKIAIAPNPAADTMQRIAPTPPMLQRRVVHVHRANVQAIVKLY
jgi:hypothetical protein